MIACRCHICSTEFNTSPQFAGSRVKCPECKEPVVVRGGAKSSVEPSAAKKAEAPPEAGAKRAIQAAILVTVAVAIAAIAFIVGHQKGKADHRGEMTRAQDQTEIANQRAGVIEAELAKRNQHASRLETALGERNAQLSEAQSAASREKQIARAAVDKLVEEKAAVEATLNKEREEAARLAESRRKEDNRVADSKQKTEAARSKPKKTAFKDFANFPEEYVGQCLKFEDVWLHGNFDRVEETRLLSPTVSSRDGKSVFSRQVIGKFTTGIAFVMAEDIGRPLDVVFKSDTKYAANLCCEVTRSEKTDKLYIARVYRVELLTVSGAVKEAFEEK